MFQSRISVIAGHAKDQQTDNLYEPLRKTFLEDTTAKKTMLQTATKVSHVSHFSHPRNIIQSHQLGQRTLIPEDAKLIKCYDLNKIPKNKNYCIVNAKEKQLSPISPEQLERRNNVKNKEEIIVYTYGQIKQTQFQKQKINTKLQSKSYEFKKSKVKQIQKKQPKYNLFSIIDEGINNLLKGNSCTCPANQIIAQQQQQIKWQGTQS